MVYRYPGYVSFGSRRYNECQTLAFEATTEREEEVPTAYAVPLVDHPTYPTPKKVLSRPTGNNVSKDSPIVDEKVIPSVDPRCHVSLPDRGEGRKRSNTREANGRCRDKKRTGIPTDRTTYRMTRSTIDKWITD
uniref:Uncharacterized protein n=1 Tax=Peronospora matthiolae TaxID=2874970 RepID=A0AAV1VN16_9STRA